MTINEILKMKNKDFASKIKKFQSACEKAGIKPSKRQASKWRMKKGVAYSCK